MGTATPIPSTPPSGRDPFERDRSRRDSYEAMRAFFEGEQWEGAKRRPRETRLVVNYSRALLRKVVSYALPDPVTFKVPAPERTGAEGEAVDDAGSAGDGGTGAGPVGGPKAPDVPRTGQTPAAALANRVERRLAERLDELDADRLDFALLMDSSVLGDGAMKVTWDTAAKRPRMAAVDPATLIAWWSPDTPTEAYRVAQHYGLTGHAIERLGWARPGALDRDKLFPVVEDWTAESWTVTVAGQTAREGENPYGWLPYLVLPNNQSASAFWGESDLVDLVPICRQLNTRMGVLADLLDLSGAPIAVLENVDGTDGVSVGPGAKWELPEGAKAYLLDLLSGGGVGLHIQYVEELLRSLHALAETPRAAFGEGGRAIAGAALEVELQPLVQKVKRKRRGMGALHRRRNAMLLDLEERFGGAPIGGLRRTVPVWPAILPSDREAEARVGAQLAAAMIRSRRSVAADLGEEDADGELARVIEEARLLSAVVAPPASEARRAAEEGSGEGGEDRGGGEDGAADEGEREPRSRTAGEERGDG